MIISHLTIWYPKTDNKLMIIYGKNIILLRNVKDIIKRFETFKPQKKKKYAITGRIPEVRRTLKPIWAP